MKDTKKLKKEQIKKYFKDNGIIIYDLKQISHGINSQTFSLKIKNKKRVLKFYPKEDFLNRDRLSNELNFLQFLEKYNMKNIPSPILWDTNKNWMILSWLEGKKIEIIQPEHVKLLNDFILKTENLKYKKDAKKIQNASEACFDLNSHINCINKRFSFVNSFLKDFNSNESSKFEFFNNFINYIDYEINEIKSKFINSSSRSILGKELSIEKKILSQSDVGFHNIFLSKNSELQFFDFEYAGWDDPHKLIADLILQPDRPVPLDLIKELKPLFYKFINNKIDKERVYLVMQIYRIKWLLIIFNKIFKNNFNQINLDETTDKLIVYKKESNSRINIFKDFLESAYL